MEELKGGERGSGFLKLDGGMRVELELKGGMKEHAKMRENSRLEGRRWRKEGEVGGGEMLEH